MIKREIYLKQLVDYLDKPFIKIITGIRRSGKSTLLQLLKSELLEMNVPEDRILLINLESFKYSDIQTSVDLYRHVEVFAKGKSRIYVLLDEIQEVKEWEKAVNGIRVDFDSDIYITGSNSHLLSSELATLLAGRYVEIPVWPLSFSEHLQFLNERQPENPPNIPVEFEKFLRIGGFPVLHTFDYPVEMAWKIISDIYASALLRDTIQRFGIRDVELLERVVRFVFDNTGSMFSAKNVADYFKSQQRRIDLNTVYNYLNALESAYLICRIPRYDIKGREILKTNEKYFAGDHALIYAVLGYKDRLISGILENIVMLELKRRGYRVFTGKVDQKEIDFVAEKGNEKIYVQVAYKISEPQTLQRECASLLSVKDHYPKYLLTMDYQLKDTIEGIKVMSIPEFLLGKLD